MIILKKVTQMYYNESKKPEGEKRWLTEMQDSYSDQASSTKKYFSRISGTRTCTIDRNFLLIQKT